MKQIKQARYALVFPGQGSQYVGMGLEIAKLIKKIVPSALTLNIENLSSLQMMVAEMHKFLASQIV